MKRLIPPSLRILGILLLLVGLVAAYYGPLEIYCFYLFSEGGPFAYDGFGLGSFWFAALAVQNVGYYVVAALCLPLGLGHLKLRRWAHTLTRLYLWFWLGTGVLLLGALALLIPSLGQLDLDRGGVLSQSVVLGLAALFFLVLLPALTLWLYNRPAVRAAFQAHEATVYWIERYPLPLLVLLLFYGFMLIFLHLAIFFQGIFPLFGQILLGRPGVYFIALCILALGILIYGTVRLKRWAWIGSVVYLALLTISTAVSFWGHSFHDVILMMDLPAYELEFLGQMVLLHDYPLVVLFTVPLLVALALALYARRYFKEAG